MSRFDPSPNADYGYCVTCGEKFQTEQLANEHMRVTLEACPPGENGHRHGHSVMIISPSRERLIKNAIQTELDNALYSFYSKIDDWLASGELTEVEAQKAMDTAYADVADGWEEYSDE